MKEGIIKWFRRDRPAPMDWLTREVRAAQKQQESGKRRASPRSKRPWESGDRSR